MVYSQISDISSLCLSPLLTLVRLSDPEGYHGPTSYTRAGGVQDLFIGEEIGECIYSLHLHVYYDVILIAIILCHVDVDIYIPAVNLG